MSRRDIMCRMLNIPSHFVQSWHDMIFWYNAFVHPPPPLMLLLLLPKPCPPSLENGRVGVLLWKKLWGISPIFFDLIRIHWTFAYTILIRINAMLWVLRLFKGSAYLIPNNFSQKTVKWQKNNMFRCFLSLQHCMRELTHFGDSVMR